MANDIRNNKKKKKPNGFGKRVVKQLGRKDSIIRRLKRKSIKELEKLGL